MRVPHFVLVIQQTRFGSYDCAVQSEPIRIAYMYSIMVHGRPLFYRSINRFDHHMFMIKAFIVDL